MNLNSDPKNTPSTKFEPDEAIMLKIIQVSSFFPFQKISDTLETKGCHGNIFEQWALSMYAKCVSKEYC